jgi:hypothetical protein
LALKLANQGNENHSFVLLCFGFVALVLNSNLQQYRTNKIHLDIDSLSTDKLPFEVQILRVS